MQHAAVIGAGELGGAIAHLVARRDVARAITLVDESGDVAAGKALDIAQAAAIEGFATALAGTADVSMVAGAAVIVVADRVPGGEWGGDDGFMLLRRLTEIAPRAIVLCAGASQRELVERGVLELRIDRRQLFGTAPEALAAAVRALVALAINGSPNDVALSVLGVPPAQTIVAWEDATAGGFGLTRLLDEATRRRLAARAGALWPPGPHALAAAAAKAVASIAGRSRAFASCFVAPDTSAGTRTRTAALPVRLGGSGIVDVMMPSLSVVERVALENAMQI